MTGLIAAMFVVVLRRAAQPAPPRWFEPEVPTARARVDAPRPGTLCLERCAGCARPTLAALQEPRAAALAMPREVCCCP